MCASISSRKCFSTDGDRRVRELAQPADGGQLHRFGKLVHQFQIGGACPCRASTREDIHHFLRPHAARNALAARFVAEKGARRSAPCRACSVPSAQTTIAPEPSIEPIDGQRLEIQPDVDHRRRKIARRWSRRRERLQAFFRRADSARLIENHFRHRRAHRDDENPRLAHVSADADEFQSRRPALPLRFVPVHALHQNLRHVRERLDVVQRRRLVPQAVGDRKRRLVARLGALAFDRFDQRGFFAANVAAGTDENLELESEIRSRECPRRSSLSLPAAMNLFFEDLLLRLVFVADIQDAAPRARSPDPR